MKVVNLTMEGFSCYRKPVEIDFSDIELFAITGPTGAGKSSLVDAIIFALYGRIPRVNTEVSSIVSQGMKKMSVLLTFSVGPKEYKIGRTFQLSKGSQCILDEKKDGDWTGVCSGVQKVNQKVKELLGLDYDAFTRCIVLPQGQFQAFLQDSNGRQEILRSLLDLEILVEMQKEASRVYETCKDKVQTIHARLDAEFSGISSESIAQIKERYDSLEKQIKTRQSKLQELEKNLREANEIVELMAKIKQAKAEYQILLPVQKEITELEKKVSLGHKILPLSPKLELYNSYKSRVKQAEQGINALKVKEIELIKQQKEIEKKLSQAEKDKERIPELDQQQNNLSEVKHLSLQLKEKESQYQQTDILCKKETSGLAELQKRLKEISRDVENLRTELEVYEKSRKDWENKKCNLRKFEAGASWIQTLKHLAQETEKKKEIYTQAYKARDEKKACFDEVFQTYQQQEANLKKIQKKAKDDVSRETLEQKLASLEQAFQLCKQVQYHSQNKKEEESSLSREDQERENLSAQIAGLKEEMQTIQAKIHEMEKECEEKQSLYDQALPLLTSYQELGKSCQETEKSLQALQEKEEKITRSIASMEKEKAELKTEKETVQESLAHAQEHWMSVYTNDLAVSLRKHVVVGKPCPVCKHKVTKLPPEEPALGEDVKELDANIARIREELKEAERKLTERETKLASSKESLAEVVRTRAAEEEKLRQAKSSLEESIQKLAELLGDKDFTKEMERMPKQIAKLAKEKETIVHKCNHKNSELVQQEAMLQSLTQRGQERKKAISRCDQEMQNLQAQISKLTDSVNIEEDMGQIRSQIAKWKALEEQSKKIEKEVNELKSRKEIAWEQYRNAENWANRCLEEQQQSSNEWKKQQEIARTQTGIIEENIEQALDKGLEQYKDACSRLEHAAQEKEKAKNRLSKQEIEIAKLEPKVQQISESLKTHEEQLAVLKENCEKLWQKIWEATGGRDVDQCLQQIKEEKLNIQKNYQKVYETSIRLQSEHSNFFQEKARVQADFDENIGESKKLETEFKSILNELGFNKLEEIISLNITPDTMSSWDNLIRQKRISTQRVEQHLQSLQEELGDRKTSPEAIQKLEAEKQECGDLHAQNVREHVRLSQEMENTKGKLDQIKIFEQQLKELQAEESIYYQLSLDLRADRFQSYAIEEGLRTLAEDGTKEFEVLSGGRYAFAVDNREIFIIDHWNNDERRPCKTLSGGESFIASLSLALALAERIYQLGQKTGGTVALESLFLDEGFGTLDDEHLDIVIESLSALKETGRTVGIISHLQKLNNCLPSRLVVTKHRDGSTVTKESN